MRKYVYWVQVLAVVLVLLLNACKKKDKQSIPDQVQVGDSILVNFPQGSINSTNVKISKTNDPETDYTFNETKDIFGVKEVLPYQIKLNIGSNPPQSDSILLSIILPESFVKSVPANYGYEVFAQVYQDGGEEVIDLFEILTSKYKPATRTLTALLPKWIFTSKRNGDKTYEAIFMVGATPGANSPRMQTGGDGAGNRVEGTFTACQAGQIYCPIGNVAICTSKMTSQFGTRSDPISGAESIHWGVDFGVAVGTAVNAASDGTVELVKTQTDSKGNVIGYGKYVVLRHANGSATLYAHLSDVLVQKGQMIKAKQKIAHSGNTGKSTGPHLHFEYVPNGQIIQSKNRIDPSPCVSEGNAEGSITIRDNGNLADDAFQLFLDGIMIGNTQIGASNSIALSNLRPGEKTLKMTCTIAPDNVGTYEIILKDGIVFSAGGDRMSGTVAEGASASWTIVIPKNGRLDIKPSPMQPNTYIEH
jgi:murein DD-endopeptidase MepM/ murein hydrolase activator NlpD